MAPLSLRTLEGRREGGGRGGVQNRSPKGAVGVERREELQLDGVLLLGAAATYRQTCALLRYMRVSFFLLCPFGVCLD